MTTRYFALMPGGYLNDKEAYKACATMEEAKTILEENAGHMFVNGLHAYDGDREPWKEHGANPDYELLFDSDGVIQVSKC